MGAEIDNILSGIIILLLTFALWKWFGGRSSCGQSDMTLSCGCQYGKCRCRGVARVRTRNRRAPMNSEAMCADKCGNDNPLMGDVGAAPIAIDDNGNYSGDVIKDMSLEHDIVKSQHDYINGAGFSGLPTGASSATILETMGRTINSSNFVGLTQRKFCKARYLAKPGKDARVVPTSNDEEWCGIRLNELI